MCSTAVTIVHKTRLSMMCSSLRPSRAIAICTFALLGSVGNWALTVLTGNNSYSQLWDVTEEYVCNVICMCLMAYCFMYVHM